MIYGTDKPIIIWAFGNFVSIAEEAIAIYHRDINPDIQFQVIPVLESEIIELLNVTPSLEKPNIILVEDINIRKYLEAFPSKFMILDNELDIALFKPFKISYISDINSHLVGVPCSSGTVALYYRKDIFEQFGFEITENTPLDSYIEYGQMIKEETGKYLLPPVNTFATYLMQATGQLFYDEYGSISSQNSEELFLIEKRMADNDIIPVSQMNDDEINHALLHGDIVSIIGEPYIFSRIKELMLDTNENQIWDVVNILKSSPFLYNVNSGDLSWMVLNQEDDSNPDYTYVLDFLVRMFATNDEISSELLHFAANNYDVVPAVDYMSYNLEDLDNNGCFEKNVIRYLDSLDYEIPNIYYNLYTNELKNYLNQLSTNVVNGLVPVEDAVIRIENVIIDDFYNPPHELSSIKIIKQPNKINYYNNEFFNPEGMVVRAHFEDGASYDIRISMKNILLTIGMSKVTIEYTYEGITKSADQIITVSPRSLIGLRVEVKDRYYFHNYVLQNSDFDVWAIYDVGDDYKTSNFEIYPKKLKSCDYENITISYEEGNMYASKKVTIEVRKTLEAIHIIRKPTKILYSQGEMIELSGIGVEAEFSNCENEVISPYRLRLDNNYVHFEPGETKKEVTVSYSYCGITEKTSFLVTKKVGTELEDANIEQAFDESGRGVINLNTGLFHYFYDDFSNSNPTSSIGVVRCYNPNSNYQSFSGDGWRLNYQQELIRNNGKWTLYTYDGKSYLFDNGFLQENDRASVRNEKLGLDLFYDGENEKVTLVDRNNNSMLFEKISGTYRLIQMHNYPSTTNENRSAFMVEINYDNEGKILNITGGAAIDGIRPTISFFYGSNNLIKSIAYNATTVCKYFYDGTKLASIRRCNLNISNNYEEITSFSYNNHFSIFNQLKKDGNCFYELRYLMDSKTDKVTSFSYGYGEEDRDVTNITYKENTNASDPQDCFKSVILNYKNNYNVINLSENQIISNYSYKIDNSLSNPHLTPQMIMSAQSYGLSPLSINDKYAETLSLIHNDFEDGVDDWSGAMVNQNAFVCGTQSIKTTSNSSGLSKEFTNIGGDGTTCYASLWVMNASSIYINVKYGEEHFDFSFKINKSLSNIWQYFTVPLGILYSKFTVTIRVNGSNSQMDDFRIIKAPYEVKEEYPDIKYNAFGNAEYVREYNPIDDSVTLTRYWYDDNHQCILSTKSNTKSDEMLRIQNEYNDGLIISTKTSSHSGILLEESREYTNDICTKNVSVNNVTTTTTYSADTTTTTIVGHPYNPDNVYAEKLYKDSTCLEKVSENELQNKYSYNDKGYIAKVESGKNNNSYSTTLDFTYDSYGNVHETKIGNVALVMQTFDKKNKLSTSFANGTSVNFSYDDEDRVIGVKENNAELFNISYVDKTKSEVQINHSNGMIYNSKKVWSGFVTSQYEAYKDGYNGKIRVENYAENPTGNISKVNIYAMNNSLFESITSNSNKEGNIANVHRVGYGPVDTDYQYDDLQRLSLKNVKYLHNTQYCQFKKYYEYKKITNAQHSTLPEIEKTEIAYREHNKTHAYKYEYYNNGNIFKIFKDNVLKNVYTYDNHNRITSEENHELKKYFTFDYDNGGNIVSKKTYLIINGQIDFTQCNTNTYNYDTINQNCGQNSSWGDQLKSYNDNPITYDACGNPISYLGRNMRWKGRTLEEIDSVLMKYDSNGLRIQKGNKIFYWYNGNLVLECWKENDDEKFIYYFYDETGVCGMHFEYQDYYFEKNILGDIVGIYDSCGNLICRYIYDAWGNHKVVDANDNELSSRDINIGLLNPFRYRGYYWDREFNLYYLKSRYYDAELGRFISPDAISYTNPESVIGYNLYAYCNDNPIRNIDPDGTIAISALLIGLIVSLAATALNDYLNDGKIFNGDISFFEYIGSGVAGLLGGAAGQAGNVLLRIGGAIGSEIIGGLISGNVNYSWASLKTNIITGLISSGIAEGISILGKRIARSIYAKGFANASKNGQKQLSRFIKKCCDYNVTNQSALKVIEKLNKFTRAFDMFKNVSGNFYSFTVGAFGNIIEW